MNAGADCRIDVMMVIRFRHGSQFRLDLACDQRTGKLYRNFVRDPVIAGRWRVDWGWVMSGLYSTFRVVRRPSGVKDSRYFC